jgi:hypothetical protein
MALFTQTTPIPNTYVFNYPYAQPPWLSYFHEVGSNRLTLVLFFVNLQNFMKSVNLASSKGTLKDFKSDVLNDYYIAALSRQISILGRKEVLSSKCYVTMSSANTKKIAC